MTGELPFWREQRATMRDLLERGDRERFLGWTPIVDAMFFEPPPDELRYLQGLANWPFARWIADDSYDWTHKEIVYSGSNYYLFGVRR